MDIATGKYRHYKGKEYEVIGCARHSETLEELVVYRALYGDHGLWVRPKDMFLERVLVGDKMVRRFEPIWTDHKERVELQVRRLDHDQNTKKPPRFRDDW